MVLNLNVDQRRGRLVIENLLDYYYIIILKILGITIRWLQIVKEYFIYLYCRTMLDDR